MPANPERPATVDPLACSTQPVVAAGHAAEHEFHPQPHLRVKVRGSQLGGLINTEMLRFLVQRQRVITGDIIQLTTRPFRQPDKRGRLVSDNEIEIHFADRTVPRRFKGYAKALAPILGGGQEFDLSDKDTKDAVQKIIDGAIRARQENAPVAQSARRKPIATS